MIILPCQLQCFNSPYLLAPRNLQAWVISAVAPFTASGKHQHLQKAPNTCTSTTLPLPPGAQTARDFHKVGENATFCDTVLYRGSKMWLLVTNVWQFSDSPCSSYWQCHPFPLPHPPTFRLIRVHGFSQETKCNRGHHSPLRMTPLL